MSCPPPSKRAKFERKPDLYAEDFNHPKADVILRCREGRKKEEGGATLFAIRRLMLITASAFFEDLFDLPQGEEVERVRWEGAHDLGFLPVVDLEEDYLDIGAVFGLVHRFDHTQFNDLQMEHSIKDHLRLLDIAEKYNLVGAVLLISASLGDLLGTEEPLRSSNSLSSIVYPTSLGKPSNNGAKTRRLSRLRTRYL